MSSVFVTGSANGLGKATAQILIREGHRVVVHVRAKHRLDAVRDLIAQGAAVVIGDLADLEQTRSVADQVNALGPVDVVIHNAGVYSGLALLPVNVVAPYALTVLIQGPKRLIYLSSGMHRGGRPPGRPGLEWPSRQRFLLRHQAVRDDARRRRRAALARGLQRLRRPGMGTHRRWAGRTRQTICGSGISRRNGSQPATRAKPAQAAATGTTSDGSSHTVQSMT